MTVRFFCGSSTFSGDGDVIAPAHNEFQKWLNGEGKDTHIVAVSTAYDASGPSDFVITVVYQDSEQEVDENLDSRLGRLKSFLGPSSSGPE